MIKLSFQPKDVTKKLLGGLPGRSKDVLTKRYGLGKTTDRMTLEAIGREYSITRERVRQIEEYSLNTIRKSDSYKESEKAFAEIKGVVDELGSVVSETNLLDCVSDNQNVRNHIHFILVVGDQFFKFKEDDNFSHRWVTDKNLALTVENSIIKLCDGLTCYDIVPESELIKTFMDHLKDISSKYKTDETVKRWLALSKKIAKNPLGEWGLAESSNINVKGIRDLAYLVLRRHGSPMHFRELSGKISDTFKKKVHVATTHNELIKDPRFVLVGRGLYALKDWGYSAGVVKDVIRQILEKDGPLNKEDIIKKVLKERYVKENTIIVNLQNQKAFKRDKVGKYYLA
ncbi:MAG TPA: sigma factor-like helix-turn-helix DNA-binding protein [Candidatus Paceibacterota bacterium]|nr:sigma factor-like helix-turn-helix DNA-binding protein [Candidatus Paceibacterota bacterium]HRZ34531.1 sigma factor-like helix-turn-helix DNA-binding protein [Candidatus Paceibacterota bacterium]